jgi:hypothetical protein
LFSIVSQDSKNDALKGKAIGALTLILEDSGEPYDWETTGNVVRVGLAIEPYKLSGGKMNKLNGECELLDKYELGQYKLTIRNSASEIKVGCGSKTLEPPVVTVSRAVFIDGDYGTATLEMY